MLEILKAVFEVAIWLFTEIIPQILNASLGAIGELTDALGIVDSIFKIL